MNFYLRVEWRDGRWRAWLRTRWGEWEVTRWLPLLRRLLPVTRDGLGTPPTEEEEDGEWMDAPMGPPEREPRGRNG